jgi:peptidoglycan/LPS O-acetylase OafA/YrhL
MVSYGVYLVHPIVREALAEWVYGPEHWVLLAGSRLPSLLFFVALVLAVSYAAAWLSWHLFERHWLSLKRYFESAEAV